MKDEELKQALVNNDIKRISKILSDSVIETKEDMEKHLLDVSKKWWKNLDGVKYYDWKGDLFKHTFPFYTFLLDRDLVKRTLEEDKKARKELIDKIDNCLSLSFEWDTEFYSNGVFIKLDSRSPKDYIQDFQESKLKSLRTGREIVDALMGSLRTFEDLCFLVKLEEPIINLHIKPFEELNRKEEWRVFVKDRKVIGISQQFYEENFNYSERYLNAVKNNLEKFIETKVIPNIAVPNFVVDTVVFLHARYLTGDKNGEKHKIVIIETNPYYLSDPCLFESYEELENTKETFRFVK
jgi:hypothetical protein|nr:MAG TPA: hypothetical protein [Caudoviricetes sp.]